MSLARLLLVAVAALPQGEGPASPPASRPGPGASSRPSPLDRALARARSLYAREDFPGAETALREALALAPERAEVHLMLGALHLRVRRYADSARAFERGLSLDPSQLGTCPWIGHAYHELGDLDTAEAWYRKVLAASAANVEARRGLAATLFKRGEHDEAERLFRAVAAAAKPGSAALGDARRYLGEILLGRGEANAAILEFQAAKAEDPFSPEVAYGLARAFALAGEAARAAEEQERHRKLNEHRQEVEALRDRLRAKPDDAEAHGRIAVHLAAMGDFEGAERSLRRGIAVAPENPASRIGLVDFLESRERFDEARAALDEASALLPSEATLFERAFRFHRARGNFDAMYAAAEAYHRLTGRAPK